MIDMQDSRIQQWLAEMTMVEIVEDLKESLIEFVKTGRGCRTWEDRQQWVEALITHPFLNGIHPLILREPGMVLCYWDQGGGALSSPVWPRCHLCGMWSDYDHIRSIKHKRKQDWIASMKPQYWVQSSEPYTLAQWEELVRMQHALAEPERSSTWPTSSVQVSSPYGPVLSFQLTEPIGITFDEKLISVGVSQGSQAQRLGIQLGWRLISVGDKPVRSQHELKNELADLKQEGIISADLAFDVPVPEAL